MRSGGGGKGGGSGDGFPERCVSSDERRHMLGTEANCVSPSATGIFSVIGFRPL